MIICVSGFACNGKTTILKILSGLIPKEYTPHMLQETARIALDLTRNFNLQNVNNERIELEALVGEYIWLLTAKDIKGNHIFLKDRHFIDVLAFMELRGMIKHTQAVRFLYDLVDRFVGNRLCDVTVLVNGTTDKSFINKCMGDKDRETTLEDFEAMQRKFYSIWKSDFGAIEWYIKHHHKNKPSRLIEIEHPSVNPMVTMEAISEILNVLKEEGVY